MNGMFYGCTTLNNLNLSNFDTSKVTDMQYMFCSCTPLISLNLSNFDTSKVTSMYYMFYNCTNLEYINLENFDETKLTSYNNMFYNVPDNVVICINEDKTKNKIFSLIKNKKCYFHGQYVCLLFIINFIKFI